MIRKKIVFWLGLTSVIFILSAVAAAQNAFVLANDFEKGTQKWEARGAVSIESSKDEAASGTKSLKVTKRSAFWNGAQLNVTNLISSGKTYQFTISVKLAKKEQPDEIKMTMQGGDNNFQGVGAASVNADGWTTISGKFKPSGKEPYLLVYIEAGRADTSFFIDDFKIENLGDDIPKQSGVILQNDFEDNTAQNWFERGDGVQMFSSNAAGSQSLKVAGRTKNWNGLQLDISPLIFKGRTYEFSVQVRLVKGQPKDNLLVTIQQTPQKGDVQYVNVVPPTEVTDAEWTTLTGKYTATTQDNNIIVYIEAAGATTSYFIDNFSIKIP